SGGGYKTSSAGVSQDRGIYVLPIPGAAHHLDLRTPNTCDPNTVANARYQIVQILTCWVKGCQTIPKLNDLPKMVVPNNVTCKDIDQGYPWGQSNSGSTLFHAVTTVLIICIYSYLF
ncbi:hypothetical protein OESDEN_24458, partial [Oesophagostomum dentatum]